MRFHESNYPNSKRSRRESNYLDSRKSDRSVTIGSDSVDFDQMSEFSKNKIRESRSESQSKSHIKAFKGRSGDIRSSKVELVPTCKSQNSGGKQKVIRFDRSIKAKSQKFRDDTSIGDKSLGKQSRKKKPRRRESSVKSTDKVRSKKDKKGCKVINQYTNVKKLGQGTFATVYLCKDNQSGTLYALKRMNKSFLSRKPCGNTKSAYDCVREELKVLKRLEHPNVIWLHEIIDD